MCPPAEGVSPLPGESWASKEVLISSYLRNLVEASEQVLLKIGNNLYKRDLSYVTAKLITPPWVTTPFYRDCHLAPAAR